MAHSEGQIWINKTNPHTIKYFVCNKLYEILPSESIPLDSGDDKPTEGDLVAISVTQDGTIFLKKAKFPDDINKVVGLMKPSEDGMTTTDGVTNIERGFPINEGTVRVPKTCFKDTSTTLTVGKTVYWDITSTSSGKLTVSTPNQAVSYNNLPTVGHIVSVETNYVTVYVNMSGFDNTIEFSQTVTTVDADKAITVTEGEYELTPKTKEVTHNIPLSSGYTYSATFGGAGGVVFNTPYWMDETNKKLIFTVNSYQTHSITVSGTINYKAGN